MRATERKREEEQGGKIGIQTYFYFCAQLLSAQKYRV